MSYGDGSVTEIMKPTGKPYQPKRWRICISYMKDVVQEDGSIKRVRKKVQRNHTGTKAEANAIRDELITQYDSNGNLRPEIECQIEEQKRSDTMTLSKLVEIWLNTIKMAGTTTEKTFKGYKSDLAKVEAHLGSTPVKQINAQMIEATYAAIKEERNLSSTTMNHIHVLLKSVFQKGIDYDLLFKNPCSLVVAPKREKPDRKSLTNAEAVEFLKAVDETEYNEYEIVNQKEERRTWREEHGTAKPRRAFRGLHSLSCIIAVRIGLATGMRLGEVLGLTWERINLERKSIQVLKATSDKSQYKTTKTDAGMRTLAIDSKTAEHLTKWKSFQSECLKAIGIKQTDKTPVICSNVGTVHNKRNFETWWDAWREEHGFASVKFHELRHTQATQLLSNGIDVKTVADRLGHADPSITLRWYAHAIPENDHEAAELIGSLFAEKDSENGDDLLAVAS